MSFTESIENLVEENESGLLSAHPPWIRVRLADVCEILNGYPFSSKKFRSGGGTPLIRIRDVLRGDTDTHYVGDFDPQYLVQHGELIVGMDGDFNCALWRGDIALLNQRVCKLTPDQRVYDLNFLASVLPGYLQAINSKTSSITVKHLSSKTVADIPLPLPPREEQRRLAGEIDSYSTRIVDAESTLERVRRNLQRYRASVLQAAVEGRLVPTEAELARAEDRDYERACVLLERALNEPRLKSPKPPLDLNSTQMPDLPEGWTWASLDQLSYIVRNGYSKKPLKAGPVKILRISAVRPMSVNLDDTRWLPGQATDYSRYLVANGDLLFTRYNGNPSLVGVSGVVKGVDEPIAHPDKLIKVRLAEVGIDPGYIEIATNTGTSRRFIESRIRTTAGQAGISGGDVKQIPIPLPPFAEQERISREVERRLSLSEGTMKELDLAKVRISRLRQSILKSAFEGKLVDQDPSDEPASALLERIRAERQARGSSRAAGRGRRRSGSAATPRPMAADEVAPT